jgi:hypothetical protein
MGMRAQGSADEIRAFVQSRYFGPARERQEATVYIRAGDVHKELGLDSRMPSVCSVLDSKKTQEGFSVQLVQRQGPPAGANVEYIFQLLASPTIAPLADVQSPAAKRQIPASGSSTPRRLPTSGVFLVSCVSKKRSAASPAKELYLSDWFIKARHAVEATGRPWFILSAKYGLVDPATVIETYDTTLKTMGVAERRVWADRVYLEIKERFALPTHFVILAGATYREFLANLLLDWGATIDVPLEGLRIGEQLQWFGQTQ